MLLSTPSVNRFANSPREFLPIANAHSNQLTSPNINKRYRKLSTITHLAKLVLEMKHLVQVLKVVFSLEVYFVKKTKENCLLFSRNTENAQIKASDSTNVFFLS